MTIRLTALAAIATLAAVAASTPTLVLAQASPPPLTSIAGPVGSTYQCPRPTTAARDHYGCVPKGSGRSDSVDPILPKKASSQR